MHVNLPPGEVGNPQAIPQCTDNEFQDFNCPADAQVGILNATFVTAPGSTTSLTRPPPADDPDRGRGPVRLL